MGPVPVPGPWEVAVRRVLRIPARLAFALAVGALWWWAVLRLTLAPAEAGPVEGAVAVGGWGLGLLPVHCVPGPAGRRRGAADRLRGGAGGRTAREPWNTGDEEPGTRKRAGG
ncbi:hypothetical protein ABZY44_30700 [Streptomyces sp. NPDC006544]|uniref:hypothetical protein n=1 Tax=Streptomyces sp. NPDC006544 TaxID=3154583 RepID=UPI0033A13695